MKTERLKFRKYHDEDFPFLQGMLADKETMKYIGEGKVKSREQALEFLYWIYRAYREEELPGLQVLVRRSDGTRIGHAGLVSQVVNGKKEVEIGYWIVRDEWGKGYATEAAIALREWGFRIGCRRLVSLIHPENIASSKVAERTGMQFERETDFSGRQIHIYALRKGEADGISRA